MHVKKRNKQTGKKRRKKNKKKSLFQKIDAVVS